MKGAARLIIFFSLSFMLILCCAASMYIMLQLVEGTYTLPNPVVFLAQAAGESFLAAVPWALYITLLLTSNYASRKGINPVVSILLGLFLAVGFSMGAIAGASRLERLEGPSVKTSIPGGPGAILLTDTGLAVLPLGPHREDGPLATVSADGHLQYRKVRSIGASILGRIRFGLKEDTTPFFLESLVEDADRCAAGLAGTYAKGLPLLAIQLCAQAFLLLSFWFVLDITTWPMANLFMGSLIFRGILSFASLANSTQAEPIIRGFMPVPLDGALLGPIVLLALGAAVYLYSAVHALARGWREKHA